MFDLLLRDLKERILTIAVSFIPTFLTPNHLTSIAFFLGILCIISLSIDITWFSFIFWAMNRCLDGIDGTVARLRGLQSDFGGYYDIICDFIIYAGIPIAIVNANPNFDNYFWVAVMEGSFFVNAASLFCLSAILEKKALGAKNKKELTSISMPNGLIEGGETVLFYSLFILLPKHIKILFQIFTLGVCINIAQRLYWAKNKI